MAINLEKLPTNEESRLIGNVERLMRLKSTVILNYPKNYEDLESFKVTLNKRVFNNIRKKYLEYAIKILTNNK